MEAALVLWVESEVTTLVEGGTKELEAAVPFPLTMRLAAGEAVTAEPATAVEVLSEQEELISVTSMAKDTCAVVVRPPAEAVEAAAEAETKYAAASIRFLNA